MKNINFRTLFPDLIRLLVLCITKRTKWLVDLYRRTLFTEIGFTGHVSLLDKDVAEKEGLKPLNPFEKWLFKPYILYERQRHREAFRKACINVLGEDPETDWV